MKTINDYADLVKEQHALNTTIAPVETDLTSASKAYSVGQKFIYDGVLYQAKTAIAQGAALVLNTNYEATDDVSSEIQTLTNKLSDEVETRATLGAKNILPNIASTEEKNGITFTVNSDGSITVSGTASAETSKNIFTDLSLNGNYILSGCPVGGSPSDNTGYNLQAQIDNSYGHVDSGNGHAFSVSTKVNRVLIHIANGVVISTPITFKPMIRLATDADTAYQPYAMTNKELTENVGVKNVTITPETGVTIDYNGSHKIGNLVILNFRFILDASFSVVEDVPIVRIDTPPLDEAILTEASTAWDGSVGGLVTILKRTNIIKLSAVGNFAAGRSYVVNVAYVCA